MADCFKYRPIEYRALLKCSAFEPCEWHQWPYLWVVKQHEDPIALEPFIDPERD